MPNRRKGPDGLTNKQRDFVKEYLVNGRSGADAYLAAFDAGGTNRETARKRAEDILRKPEVQKKIRQQTERLQDVMDITTEKAVKMVQDAYNGAMADGQYAAATSAAKLYAQLGGLLVDKKRIDVRQSYEQMSDAQLLEEVDKRRRQLPPPAPEQDNAPVIDLTPEAKSVD